LDLCRDASLSSVLEPILRLVLVKYRRRLETLRLTEQAADRLARLLEWRS
jgi:hypothetical protein